MVLQRSYTITALDSDTGEIKDWFCNTPRAVSELIYDILLECEKKHHSKGVSSPPVTFCVYDRTIKVK